MINFTKTNKLSFGRGINTNISRFKDPISLTSEEDTKIASKWLYCSDHFMAAGATPFTRVNHSGKTRPFIVATWNKLNSNFIHHVTRPAWQQGYYMQQEKIPSAVYPGLSKRDEECIQNIQRVLLDGNVDVLCIQECSTKVFECLTKEFAKLRDPDRILVYKSASAPLPGNKDIDNHVVTLLKDRADFRITNIFSKALWSRKYLCQESKSAENPRGIEKFGLDIWRPALFVEAELRTCSARIEKLTIGNLHISCAGESDEYKGKRCQEIADHLHGVFSVDTTILLSGDYNSPESVVNKTGLQEYVDLVDEYGHVDAKKQEVLKIDKILIKPRDTKMTSFCYPVPRDEIDPVADRVHQEALSAIVYKTN